MMPAFKIYKPITPHGRECEDGLHNGQLPWVYGQDPSSGYAASMVVVPAAELSFQQNAHRQAQEALLAQGSELADCQAENLRMRDALENCRLLAARHRKEEWASHVLRFCDDAGVSGKVLGHNPPGDQSAPLDIIALVLAEVAMKPKG